MSIIDFFATYIKPRRLRGTGCLNPHPTKRLSNDIATIRQKDVNIYAISTDTGYILFDTGYADEPIIDQLATLDITPHDIRAIVLTHADVDHAGGLDALHVANPSIPIYCHTAEQLMLTGREKRFRFGPIALTNPLNYTGPYTPLRDGQTIPIDGRVLRVFHTPGHTPGHTCYLIDDTILVSGDCMAFNSTGGYCFFDLFNMDTRRNIKSLICLEKLLEPYTITTVLSGHSGIYQGAKIFAHKTEVATGTKKHPFDPTAPYDVFVS